MQGEPTAGSDDGVRGDLRFGTIGRLVRSAAAEHGDREALVDLSAEPAVRLGFDELATRARELGAALVAAGIEPGDRVAVWAPNCWEWVVTLLGMESAGAVLVPLNTRYKGLEAAEILRRSRARMLFTVEGFLGNDYVSMLRDATPEGIDTLDLGVVLLRDTGSRPAGVGTCDELLEAVDDDARAELDRRVEDQQGDAVSDLLFTSGTTGHPKGVIQTHAQSLRAFADWADIVGLRPGDRYLCINPFFHTFGYKAGILAALMTGSTLVPLAVFDLDRVVEVIESEQISMIPGPPTIYQSLLNHPGYDPGRAGTLRLAVTGAAVVPVELVRQMREVLGFETVVTAYGLTESCGIATVCRHDDDPETIATTSGRAIPGLEVRVADDDGTPCPPGEPGEVVVRGYTVMQGYFEEPEQTAEAIDADGWLHTGDVGVMDDRGYLRITDRKKDMFIVGGFNAYPAEIEQLLLTHPDVAQAAVVGVPDERMGEVGYAFVLATAGSTPRPEELVAWAKEHMANFKAPRHVAVLDEMPLNASGKVLKYELRERAIDAVADTRTDGGRT
jgi:acyl-CoA synthetase (AMP-forming)/AMP-acid ligase II